MIQKAGAALLSILVLVSVVGCKGTGNDAGKHVHGNHAGSAAFQILALNEQAEPIKAVSVAVTGVDPTTHAAAATLTDANGRASISAGLSPPIPAHLFGVGVLQHAAQLQRTGAPALRWRYARRDPGSKKTRPGYAGVWRRCDAGSTLLRT